MIEHYKRISQQNIDSTNTYDGMEDLLNHLKADGYKCGLCTGKDRLRPMGILEKLMLNEYFDTVVCSSDSLELDLNNIDVSFENAVMVGYAPNDIICAKNIDVKSIAVSWGEISTEILKRECPNYIVDTAEDLWVVIDSIFSN